MHLSIFHDTLYTYSENVDLLPHLIRLSPKTQAHQTLISWHIVIDPHPIEIRESSEWTDTLVYYAKFTGLTQKLHIQTKSLVHTQEPIDTTGLLLPEASRLMFDLPSSLHIGLTPYLMQLSDSLYVNELAQDIAKSCHYDTVRFLEHLNHYIFTEYEREYREFGPPYPPDELMLRKKGSCRDFALLFMALCREMGLPSRFVSGYVFDPELQQSELHAWSQVYLPGCGWRGFDPSYGCEQTERHIVICSGPSHDSCAPIEGHFSGTAASSLMTKVHIQLM
jgi:transglutaminase-like putative cysteine protease